jgi:ribosomal protein S18 acetylase RimI-like enzyme
MENRFTLVIPGRALCQVVKPANKPGYFQWLSVEPRYRRQGYCLELMKFAINYSRESLEMDILRSAKSCQRNAARLGYRKTGDSSNRFYRCELWRYFGSPSKRYRSRLKLLKTIRYERCDGTTRVLYLSTSLH